MAIDAQRIKRFATSNPDISIDIDATGQAVIPGGKANLGALRYIPQYGTFEFKLSEGYVNSLDPRDIQCTGINGNFSDVMRFIAGHVVYGDTVHNC